MPLGGCLRCSGNSAEAERDVDVEVVVIVVAVVLASDEGDRADGEPLALAARAEEETGEIWMVPGWASPSSAHEPTPARAARATFTACLAYVLALSRFSRAARCSSVSLGPRPPDLRAATSAMSVLYELSEYGL